MRPEMFMPHGMCFLWSPRLLFAQIGADALIALSYFSIPVFLILLVRKRRDLPFSWVFILFAVFIVSCGTTHLISIWVIWHPDYWFETTVKWVTAGASVATAIALVPLAPKLLAFQSRAQTVDAVHESETRLRLFLQAVPHLVWTANGDGYIDWYNDRWCDYTGQTPDEALGWGWQTVHHPDDLPDVMGCWAHSLATGEPFAMEFRLLGKDGVYRWFLTRSVPERRNGVVVRWYGSCTEIDAQKRDSERSSQIARTLQEAFLTKRLPKDQYFRFDSLYRPADTDALIGGDWYDAFSRPDGRILISCGDVAGHGIDAAMIAARFRQSIAVLGIEDSDPAEIISRLNRTAMVRNDGIATVVIALFDPADRTLSYAIAGHPPPVVAFRSGKRDFLELGGIPLGVHSDAAWQVHTSTLEPTAVVVFYTDGVTEFNRDVLAAEQTLLEAAASIVAADRYAPLAQMIREFVMESASAADDVAILVLQCFEHADAKSSVNGSLAGRQTRSTVVPSDSDRIGLEAT